MSIVKITHQLAMLTLFSCTFAFVGCGKKQDTPKSDDAPKAEGDPKPETPKTPTLKPPPDLTNAKPDLTFTIDEFQAEQRKDLFHFLGNKHPGKVIEVTGPVLDWSIRDGKAMVFLRVGTEGFQALVVVGKSPWLNALHKQIVTIRTIAPINSRDTAEWQVVSSKGPPPPTMTAEELVKAAGEDGEGIKKKYGEVKIIVTGTIVSVSDMDGITSVVLSAGANAKVDCRVFPTKGSSLIPLTDSQRTALMPGQTVKVFGEYVYGFGLIRNMLNQSILLEPAP